MRHGAVRSAVAGLLAGLCLVPSGPASAESFVVDDPAGDVMKASQVLVYCQDEDGCDEDDPPAEFVQLDTGVGDIVSTTFRHRWRRVVITTTFSELRRPVAGENWEFVFLTRGANGQRRYIDLAADAAQPRGVVVMQRQSNAKAVCRGRVARRIDYAANTVRVAFPRWCAGKPRRIKVASVAFRGLQQDQGDSMLIERIYDTPLTDGGKFENFTDLAWTRWLRRH